ncbi:CAAX prenyl protease-related protein [Geobacter sulfurreducens]|uniref:CAAX prenyl protease-related protein n=1 Tax=Geobacter sulfurreducens TaxID=35554 RepID=UPI000DBB1AA3|nr:CAAX prenyl protease-related protein [Geobacter sulfurreducens]BBA70486.1 hypothetical protein YM18_1966 [Geobacter sulfurreducens]
MPSNHPSGSAAVTFLRSSAAPRILPFASLMVMIGVEEVLRVMTTRGIVSFPPGWFLYLYPVRIIVAGAVLAFCLKRCDELHLPDLRRPLHAAASVATGFAVYVLWVGMDWLLPFQSPPPGFDPTGIDNDALRMSMIIFRLLGAALIIPVLEELFWRSFLLRYLIDKEFETVPIGKLTWPAFFFSTILFGLEHHYIVAGIMAGIAYTLLLRFTGSIVLCILAHAVTNLALGLHVINRQAWHFW